MQITSGWISVALRLTVALAVGAPACAQDPGDVTFPTASAEFFGDATPALEVLLRQRGAPSAAKQHFCVVGYQSADGSRRAWVLWREAKRILLWEGATDAASARHALAQSRRQIDLRRQVAKPGSAPLGTGQVSPAWIDKVNADCKVAGQLYAIDKIHKGR